MKNKKVCKHCRRMRREKTFSKKFRRSLINTKLQEVKAIRANLPIGRVKVFQSSY